jgi:tripartite-type tricarboxylate transporter receptor subunit TctC
MRAKPSRLNCVAPALRAAALLLISLPAAGQENFPNRPLRMVIPWPPGQATDILGRVVAAKLTDALGQQVVADNRPGAGGMIGTDVVAKATPDGYTLLAASSGPVTINPLLQKAPYDAGRELMPVANVGRVSFLLVTSPAFPAKSASELIALVKSAPGKYSFASSGTGATSHLVGEWFNNMNGLKATHVPYKGSAPALVDVIGGQVAYTLESIGGALPLVRSGRLKAYGTSTLTASALAPDIPPLAVVANMPGFDAAAWIGVMVAAGTPKPLVTRLAKAVDEAMRTADARDRLAAAAIELDYKPAPEFALYLKAQTARFTEIIRQGNIRIE